MGRNRNKKSGGGKLQQKMLRGIFQLMDKNPGRAYNLNQIARVVGIRDRFEKDALEATLEDLVEKEKVVRVKNRFLSAQNVERLEGVVDHVHSNYAFVIIDGLADDIMVRTSDLKGAYDGDLVSIQINPKFKQRDGKRTGRVLEVLERKTNEFVGRIEVSGTYGFVIPNNRKVHQDIFVPGDKLKKAKDGSIVLVKIKAWGDHHRNPEGEVIDILGESGEHNTEMHAIMLEFGLPYKFPAKVLKEAETIPDEIPSSSFKGRKDFRSTLTFTIDPEDAKDFDDAISFKELGNGEFEIGVHIADVSHYVKQGTEIEKEAYKRATSVYLVDRTIPMLPEKLSNNLCSLRPNEDRLAYGAVFQLDIEGRVKSRWFGRTAIHSDRRYTYEEAQESLEKEQGEHWKELKTLNRIAHKLREKRFKQGSISFETQEVKFKLDENHQPIEVVHKVRKDAHKLIEDFMLLANREVASFIFKMENPPSPTFVYRTHDEPDMEKLQQFAEFAKVFGHEISIDQGNISKALNKFNKEIEGQPEEGILQGLAVRSMAKAKYTTEGRPHFGLGFSHYTHFTSPIRRYPDVMVHRMLEHYLNSGKPLIEESWEKKCSHCSEKEKAAADAERASIKYKQVEFMEKHIGEEYLGLVTSVTDFGVYVEISEFKCEGMIRIRDIFDDFYIAEPQKFRIIGQQSGQTITVGDEVMVEVSKADLNKRILDLIFIEKYVGEK